MNNRQKKRWVKRIHRGAFSSAQYFAMLRKANSAEHGWTKFWDITRLAYRMWML